MFYEFSHRHTPCLVDGVEDKVILSRDTRATTIVGKEYLFNGVFSSSSLAAPGSLVETDESFLVQTLRPTTGHDKYCSLIKTNAVIEVQRFKRAYDERHNPIGDPKFQPVAQDVKGFIQYVTARLRQDDPGLLSTTSYILQIQTSTDVRDPQDKKLLSPDRIVINNIPYQVDVVDAIKYPNLFHIQLSEDRR